MKNVRTLLRVDGAAGKRLHAMSEKAEQKRGLGFSVSRRRHHRKREMRLKALESK